jgi:hypothetical protein
LLRKISANNLLVLTEINNYLNCLKQFIMALNAYLKLTGQKQGDVKGSVTQTGREGK